MGMLSKEQRGRHAPQWVWWACSLVKNSVVSMLSEEQELNMLSEVPAVGCLPHWDVEGERTSAKILQSHCKREVLMITTNWSKYWWFGESQGCYHMSNNIKLKLFKSTQDSCVFQITVVFMSFRYVCSLTPILKMERSLNCPHSPRLLWPEDLKVLGAWAPPLTTWW